jgi:hypothetical protein
MAVIQPLAVAGGLQECESRVDAQRGRRSARTTQSPRRDAVGKAPVPPSPSRCLRSTNVSLSEGSACTAERVNYPKAVIWLLRGDEVLPLSYTVLSALLSGRWSGRRDHDAGRYSGRRPCDRACSGATSGSSPTRARRWACCSAGWSRPSAATGTPPHTSGSSSWQGCCGRSSRTPLRPVSRPRSRRGHARSPSRADEFWRCPPVRLPAASSRSAGTAFMTATRPGSSTSATGPPADRRPPRPALRRVAPPRRAGPRRVGAWVALANERPEDQAPYGLRGWHRDRRGCRAKGGWQP